MISAQELQAYIDVMRAGGCAIFKCGDTQIILGPPKYEGPLVNTSSKSDYQDMLFAATEGIPTDEEGVS